MYVPPTGRSKIVPQLTRRRLLQGLGATATAAFAAEFLPPNVRRALAAGPSGGGSLRDIKHVVILMQENRSFDHYFGTLPNVRGFSDPSAVQLSTGKSVFYQPDTANPDGYLLPYHLNTLTTSAQAQPSTSHAWAVQHSAWNNGATTFPSTTRSRRTSRSATTTTARCSGRPGPTGCTTGRPGSTPRASAAAR